MQKQNTAAAAKMTVTTSDAMPDDQSHEEVHTREPGSILEESGEEMLSSLNPMLCPKKVLMEVDHEKVAMVYWDATVSLLFVFKLLLKFIWNHF